MLLNTVSTSAAGQIMATGERKEVKMRRRFSRRRFGRGRFRARRRRSFGGRRRRRSFMRPLRVGYRM